MSENLQINLLFLLQALVCFSALVSFVRIAVFYFQKIKRLTKNVKNAKSNLLSERFDESIGYQAKENRINRSLINKKNVLNPQNTTKNEILRL